MTQNCYKIKGIYYFRKQVFQYDFRKSLKKLCGKKLYNKLLIESMIFNLTNYLNNKLENLISEGQCMSFEEVDNFVKELLKKYKQEAFNDEVSENSFIDNINSKKAQIEEKRFNAISYYEDNGDFVAGHTQKALNKEIFALEKDFDSNNFGRIANAAQRVLQRQEIISTQEIEQIPDNMRKPFFEALLKIEMDILNQDIKNFQYNTGIKSNKSEIDTDLLTFLQELKNSGQIPELNLEFKEDNWSMIINDYILGKKSENNKLKSVEDIQRDLEQFQNFLLGDLNLGIKPRNIRDINKADIIFIKQTYKKVPNLNDSQIKKIKDRGIHYLIQFAENCNNDLKRKNIKLLNIAGINAKFKNIRAFIRDLKATNPIYKDLNLDLWEKLSIPENHLSSQEKEIQSQTQISPLESDILERYLIEKYPNTAQGIKNFKVHTNSSPHVFWSKILAIYTGARSEELAQLQVSDFKRVELNGKVIFYFNIIVTDYEKQSLKTSSSRRIVPLHNNLIKLGFLNYLQERKKLKKEYLFDLTLDKYGKRKDFPRNFNITMKDFFKENYSDIEKRNPTFHSLRSHFITKYLKQSEDSRFSLVNIKKLVGHEDSLIKKDITIKHYFKEDLDLDFAYDLVNDINFHIENAQEFLETMIKKFTYEKIVEDIKL